MKFFVLTFAFVCLAQNVFGAPNQAASTSNLDDMLNNFSNAFTESASKLFGKDAVQQLQENVNAMAGNFNSMMTDMSKNAKDMEPAVKEALDKLQATLKKNVEDFQKQNPEASQTLEKSKQHYEEMMKQMVEGVKEMEKTVKDKSAPVWQDIQKGLKEAMDGATKKAQELQKQLLEKKP